jgi:pantetheine-phosphate adenylyltransferase
MRAIYPGSFDPITNGHLDVIHRASHLFDELVVAVAVNDEKQKSSLFSLEERSAFLQEVCHKIPNVRIATLEGLLVDFARRLGAAAIVRGLRAVSDFEFEFQMALMNRKIEPNIETIFMMPTADYSYLSSRIVKEIARLGGDVSSFVPACVVPTLMERLAASKPAS